MGKKSVFMLSYRCIISGVISSFIQFQSLCQLIYIAAIADKLQIYIVASDAEKQPIIANPLAIKPMEGWLEA